MQTSDGLKECRLAELEATKQRAFETLTEWKKGGGVVMIDITVGIHFIYRVDEATALKWYDEWKTTQLPQCEREGV